MTLTIPTERLGNLALDERDAVVDIAIGLYKRETVSLGRAAGVAGISSVELLAELGRRHIPINYGGATAPGCSEVREAHLKNLR